MAKAPIDRAQKFAVHEALAAVIERRERAGPAGGGAHGAAGGKILDLPEKLVLVGKGAAAEAATAAWQETGEVASALFELYGGGGGKQC